MPLVPPPEGRAVVRGAGVALAVAVPTTLLMQLADALSDDGPPGAAIGAGALLVLLGVAVGGATAGWGSPRPWRRGAAAGGAATGVLALLGALRTTISGGDVRWATVPALLLVGALVAAGGAELGRRRPARTRS